MNKVNFTVVKPKLVILFLRGSMPRRRRPTRKKNGYVAATKSGKTIFFNFFFAATKNFAAATKRFVDRTKHFFVVTNYFCYPLF